LQGRGREKEAKDLDEKRNIAKTVNFLTGYGGGAFGLQNVLAVKAIFKDIEECEKIIELFFDSYPSLRALLQLYKGFILNKGCAVSIFGRVRIFEEAWGGDEEAKAKALRAGCNHLIQSTASDMMLVALYTIEQRMREANLESILVSTVHDSLLIDAVRSELPVIHDIVVSTLNNFPIVLPLVLGDDFDISWMLVPFTGDCDVGLDYLNMMKIPEKDVDWDKLLVSYAL
jgi:DNA polymerase-1